MWFTKLSSIHILLLINKILQSYNLHTLKMGQLIRKHYERIQIYWSRATLVLQNMLIFKIILVIWCWQWWGWSWDDDDLTLILMILMYNIHRIWIMTNTILCKAFQRLRTWCSVKNLRHTHRQLHLYIKIYLQCIFGAFFWAIFRNTAMPDNFQNKVGSQPLFGKTLKKIIQICGRRHP